MNINRTFYQVLGVPEGVPDIESQAKAAYRCLVQRHHPDHNSGSAAAEEAFKEISAAYQVLSDKAKREVYDQQLAAARMAATQAQARAWAAAQAEAQARAWAAAQAEAQARAWAAAQAEAQVRAAEEARLNEEIRRAAIGAGVNLFTSALKFFFASSGSSSNKSAQWDESVGRYRDSKGRFKSG